MDQIAAFFTKFKDALITVGWLVAALGWVISNFQANSREKRKETRSEVDSICKAASEAIVKCRKYYSCETTDPEDDSRIAEISFEVNRILIRSDRLNRRHSTFKEAVLASGEFWDVVTREPFSSKKRAKYGPGSEVLKEIEASVHDLIDKLENGFSKKFS